MQYVFITFLGHQTNLSSGIGGCATCIVGYNLSAVLFSIHFRRVNEQFQHLKKLINSKAIGYATRKSYF